MKTEGTMSRSTFGTASHRACEAVVNLLSFSSTARPCARRFTAVLPGAPVRQDCKGFIGNAPIVSGSPEATYQDHGRRSIAAAFQLHPAAATDIDESFEPSVFRGMGDSHTERFNDGKTMISKKAIEMVVSLTR
jgi:hypothetical protein